MRGGGSDSEVPPTPGCDANGLGRGEQGRARQPCAPSPRASPTGLRLGHASWSALCYFPIALSSMNRNFQALPSGGKGREERDCHLHCWLVIEIASIVCFSIFNIFLVNLENAEQCKEDKKVTRISAPGEHNC